MKKSIIAVALGEEYVRKTEVMLASFRRHNPEYDIIRYYDNDLDAILPDGTEGWNAFSKCEIGRWAALRDAIELGYSYVLYSDGDMFWYASHVSTADAALVFSPHYLLDSSLRRKTHQIISCGLPNIGLVEARSDAISSLDVLIYEIMRDPRPWFHPRGLWTQTIAGIFSFTGRDIAWNRHPGQNVACWNLAMERWIFERNGRYMIRFDGKEFPLVSLHFHKPGKIRSFGPVCVKIVDEYEHALEKGSGFMLPADAGAEG